jgi:hypothetical protein
VKFRPLFIGFIAFVGVGFLALLPFAYSVARDARRCRDRFPEDLAQFEQLLLARDYASLYEASSAAMRRSFTPDSFETALSNKSVVPDGSSHMESLGEYALFGWQAGWFDDHGARASQTLFEFCWEEGRHKLQRIPGIVEPRRDGLVR